MEVTYDTLIIEYSDFIDGVSPSEWYLQFSSEEFSKWIFMKNRPGDQWLIENIDPGNFMNIKWRTIVVPTEVANSWRDMYESQFLHLEGRSYSLPVPVLNNVVINYSGSRVKLSGECAGVALTIVYIYEMLKVILYLMEVDKKLKADNNILSESYYVSDLGDLDHLKSNDYTMILTQALSIYQALDIKSLVIGECKFDHSSADKRFPERRNWDWLFQDEFVQSIFPMARGVELPSVRSARLKAERDQMISQAIAKQNAIS